MFEKFQTEVFTVSMALVAILVGAVGFLLKRDLRKRDEHKAVVRSYESRFVRLDGDIAAVTLCASTRLISRVTLGRILKRLRICVWPRLRRRPV